MKKLNNIIKSFLLFLTLLMSFCPAFAVNKDYVEFYEKQYLNTKRIDLYKSLDIVSFWVKSLNKEPKNKEYWVPTASGTLVQWWYTMSNIQIDCKNNKSRIRTLVFYDLKERPINQSDDITEWSNIVPDTYADGYYRLFCLVPYDENPIFTR